jgi:hypothetical protein
MMVILVLLPHNAPFAIEALPITRPDILVPEGETISCRRKDAVIVTLYFVSSCKASASSHWFDSGGLGLVLLISSLFRNLKPKPNPFHFISSVLDDV